MNRATRMHLAIWRKAYAEGKLEITLPSAAEARSFKMKLYRSMSAEKGTDPILQEISENMVIKLPEKSNTLIIGPRVTDIEEEIFRELGLEDSDLLGDAEAKLTESLSGLISE